MPQQELGPVVDADFRWVVDLGLTGPDRGPGGDDLFLPPGYGGAVPTSGYHVSRPCMNRLVVFCRAFVARGDLDTVVQREQTDWVDSDRVGLYAAFGIRRGQLLASRGPRTRLFPDRQWLSLCRGLSRQRPHLPARSAGAGPGEQLLGSGGLQQKDPFAAAQLPEAGRSGQHRARPANQTPTLPCRGNNVLLRLCGPLQPWFDQSWKPGDLVPQ